MKRIVTEADQANWNLVNIGNPESDWLRVTKDKAVEHIESMAHEYYLKNGSSETLISVVYDGETSFLRTVRDLTLPDPIDDLPRCSAVR